MRLNNDWQFSNFELSMELKELGVEQESMMYWVLTHDDSVSRVNRVVIPNMYTEIMTEKEAKEKGYEILCSAFSVAELGEMLPDDVISRRYSKEAPEISYIVRERKEGGRLFEENTEANARAKMVIHLIENGYLKIGDERC